MTDLLQGGKKTFLQKSFSFPPAPPNLSKNSYVTFIFCCAKSESKNIQQGMPMRQQIKGGWNAPPAKRQSLQ